MLLVSIRSSTPGRRTRASASYGFQLKPHHPRLNCGYATNAGHGLYGCRTVRTKGGYSVTPKYTNLFSNVAGHFTLSMVAYWTPRARRGGAAMVLRSALGAWFNVPAVSGANPLSYIQSVPATAEAHASLKPQMHWWRQLLSVAPYARVSSVATSTADKVQFARAVGSTCQVLIPKAGEGWALVALPSGQLRLVNNLSYITVGSAHPASLRFFSKVGAGHSRRLGQRPIVRGTVRNPNDHPHGGRTRAIRYPRTPWGYTAKRSRSPKAVLKLKPLKKRHRTPTVRALPYWAHPIEATTLSDSPIDDRVEEPA